MFDQGDTLEAMDEAGETDPREQAGPDGPAESTPGERTSGIILESCYRHPIEYTGVHCTRCGRPICTDCMRPAPVGYQCPDCVAEGRKSGARPRVQVRFILGRPGSAATALIAINVAMFVLELATGASQLGFAGDCRKMFNLGADAPVAIAQAHQYWRLFTAMFLHFGVLHLALNMYALYLFGYLVENAFGSARFLAIYFASGLMASIASFAFGNPSELAAGASGAIFGLLGAWVAFNYRRRDLRYHRANLQGAYFLIILNLALGFSGVLPIDNFAHIGGLVSGVIAGAAAEGFGPPATRRAVRIAGFALLAAVGVGLVAWRVATFPNLPFGIRC
jgi:membrane associated rhomboid family serine protease